MWIKLVLGAIIGLIIGHFVTPGYAVWVIIGLVAGFIVEYVQNAIKQTKRPER